MSEELVGQQLQNLKLPSSEGGEVSIPKDLLGSWTVLFYYPMDSTPGCTKEACTFRDRMTQFRELNAKVFGVSKDSLDSHENFINKYSLNYPLLSDNKQELAKSLKVGSFLGMASRDTFLIDPQGKVAAVWRKVNATKTIEESYQKLKELTQG